MKYLIVGKNPTSGMLEWNVVESREKVISFIKFNYDGLIKKCNYSWKELVRHILIVEIEPNYEVLGLDITKPVEFSLSIKDWKH